MSTAGDLRPMVLPPQMMPTLLGGPAAPDAQGAAPGLGAGDVWRVVKQRKVLIIVTFLVLYAVIGTTTVLVWRFAPQYSSEAFLRLIPPAEDPLKIRASVLPKDYIQMQLGTEAQRMRDPQLLLEVLGLPEIKQTEYYRGFGDKFEKCLNDLKNRINATPIRETNLVRVALEVPDKSEATLIVRTLVDRYLARSKSGIADEGRERLETLKNRESSVQKDLADKREQINAARARRDVPALEADRDVQVQVIGVLNTTLAELKTRDADIEAQLETVRGMDYRNLPLSAEMRVIIEADPVLRYYRQQVEQIDIQMDSYKANRMGANHREMQLLQSQREAFFQKETARREELTDDLRSRQVESLQQERSRVRNMQKEVREQLTEREAQQRDLDQTIQQIKGWEKDAELLEKQLEQVGMALRAAENQLQTQSQEGIMKWAMVPRDAIWPSRPNFITWLGGGFVLAGLAAVGLAFLREFTDQAIRTPIDVARYGRLSVLGCVPALDYEEADIAEVEQATRLAPHSLVAEAFRQIRAHLTFSGPLESQRTLLVTSPRPDDGKTAVAVNLAVIFAQGNQRTLLIDCNFRRPAVRRAFKNTRAEGLSNFLIGRGTFDQLVSKTDLPNLDVLTSGPLPPNPAELLSSSLMRDLMATAKQKYDRVVLDGPPCLLISDALVVATQADGVVLVARAVHGTKGTLRRAREQLQRINARVIGAVLNGVEARPGGYFRQQYREFYEYTEEEVVPRELPEGPSEIDADSAGKA